MAFEKVKQAIQDIKSGKMIVMVDDEDRENEGDIVFAASFSSAEKVNFAITHAKGVLCLAMDEANAKRLDLPLMVRNNTSSHETAFTITIDAKDATTGVSAPERDLTIRLAAQNTSKPDDFVRPGHIFPLIAKKGGVLVRTGHTEGSVDLCELAGVTPMAAICEIVKEDGSMARRDYLEEFCERFGLNMVSVSDIVGYRLLNESLVDIGEPQAATLAGLPTNRYRVSDHENRVHEVYVFGNISAKSMVKFHKSSKDFEFLSSAKYMEFMSHLDLLYKNGGVFVFLDTCSNSAELIKDYGIGAQILKKLGVKEIELLSSSKNREFVGISGFGLDVVSYIG